MRSELYDKRGDIGAFFATLATEITKIGLINGVRRPGILICEALRDSYYVRLHTIPSPSPLPQPLDPSCGYIMLTLFIRFFCFYIGVILRFKTSVFRLMLFVCEEFCFSSRVFGIVAFVSMTKVPLFTGFVFCIAFL